jgi:hypothetical protein
MNRIGIKIDLDTGDLVSSAARARQAIAGISDEMNNRRASPAVSRKSSIIWL